MGRNVGQPLSGGLPASGKGVGAASSLGRLCRKSPIVLNAHGAGHPCPALAPLPGWPIALTSV